MEFAPHVVGATAFAWWDSSIPDMHLGTETFGGWKMHPLRLLSSVRIAGLVLPILGILHV